MDVRRSLAALGAFFCLSLAACSDSEPEANKTGDAVALSGDTPTAGAPGQVAPPPPPSRLSFAAGTQIVDKPDDNEGLFVMAFDPINLIDDSLQNDWQAKADVPAVLVLEPPERTEIERLAFDSAGV